MLFKKMTFILFLSVSLLTCMLQYMYLVHIRYMLSLFQAVCDNSDKELHSIVGLII